MTSQLQLAARCRPSALLLAPFSLRAASCERELNGFPLSPQALRAVSPGSRRGRRACKVWSVHRVTAPPAEASSSLRRVRTDDLYFIILQRTTGFRCSTSRVSPLDGGLSPLA